MEKPIFYIVDVFAEEKFAGNQLAVFRNTAGLTDSDMQNIAREMNYSETTFILSEIPENGGYNVRIFTPKVELPFAGHPTIGTAYIIQREIIKDKVDALNLNLKVGQIPVTIDYLDDSNDELWMRQKAPEFGDSLDIDSLAEILNIDRNDIMDQFPIQEVSTGFYTMIVPLKSLDAVKRARVSVDKLYDYTKDKKAKTILVFAKETYYQDNDLNVRFFADALGIQEDPATGSANGCLAAYLVRNKYFGTSGIDVRVEQGYEIERPSLLLLKADEKNSNIEVNVGGNAILIGKGEFV
ncbi:MAG: PhzF family phenazine biosynthesis protein [bacterium]|nr:PhzF family phenazine biosynthesis protein [bacterium]